MISRNSKGGQILRVKNLPAKDDNPPTSSKKVRKYACMIIVKSNRSITTLI